ncbi:MAG TPA: hypothetical protein VLA19_00955 [Herpetosiphonaceae bacterium]|nr:hypothetical protein [Herpetosiphonaceae bacterium]
MVIRVPDDIEADLVQVARKLGVTPEGLVLDTLRARLAASLVGGPDDWDALLLSAGSPAGVSLPDEATTREALYD